MISPSAHWKSLMKSVGKMGRAQRMAKWVTIGGTACFLVACLPPVAAPLSPEVRRQKDSVYTPQSWPSPLKADVFYRPGNHRSPGILLVHGGSWQADGARWSMNGIARKLANRGYVVVNVTYRGLPSDRYPAPIEDLRRAIQWMRLNAGAFGIDQDRIGVYGFSAGGHLAAQVALAKGNPENVKAVVTASAPFDLTLYANGDVVPKFLGGSYAEIPEVFRDASPVNHVTRTSPPIFIYQGTDDDLVQPEHAIRMQAAYRRAGMNPDIHWMKGRSHVDGFLFPGNKVDEAIDFLDATLKR